MVCGMHVIHNMWMCILSRAEWQAWEMVLCSDDCTPCPNNKCVSISLEGSIKLRITVVTRAKLKKEHCYYLFYENHTFCEILKEIKFGLIAFIFLQRSETILVLQKRNSFLPTLLFLFVTIPLFMKRFALCADTASLYLYIHTFSTSNSSCNIEPYLFTYSMH